MSQEDVISMGEASQSALSKYRIVLDTDIGDDIDDALALALVLNSPEIDLLGITTVFGDTQKRAQLAKHLLHVFRREDIPIAIGIGQPLQQRHPPSGVAQAEILGDYPPQRETFSALSGPELLIQKALEPNEQHLTLVCIGPLTNVAMAILIEPRITMSIRKIIMMGGSSGIPLPEWNVRSDVKAAQIVFQSGIPVTMIGLNVTTRCQLSRGDLARLRENKAEQTQLLYQLITIWQRHRPRWHPGRPYLHDPLTLAALCTPDLFRWQEMPVLVLKRGPFGGFMVPRLLGGALVRAAVGVDVKAAREWIVERLLS
jgi:purine nucleosidase